MNDPKIIRTVEELQVEFGDWREHPHAAAAAPRTRPFNHSIADWDHLLGEVIEQSRAIYVPPAAVKQVVALRWLGRPDATWARMRWAWRLFWRS
jgi:hypothetical protein